MQALTIIRPDDMHLHLRDGNALKAVASYAARQMGRVVIMPNLKLPVVSVADAQTYRARIMTTLSEGSASESLMTLYLTGNATPKLMREAKTADIATSELYPAGATTNSDFGVTDLFELIPLLEEMVKQGILFSVYGGVTDPEVDIFDREAVFIERMMKPILMQAPSLEAVFECIIITETAHLVLKVGDNATASATPQHLLLDRNDLLVSGVRPHHFRLPVLRCETHRQALVTAVIGNKAHKFFLGTNSAPHAKTAKENAYGRASMFSAMTTTELYAEVFEKIGMLDKLEALASQNGPHFYGLSGNSDTIILVEQAQTAPASAPHDDSELVPMRAGDEIEWAVQY